MRKFIEYLYKRFPPRLVVSVADFTSLREELASYNTLFQGVNQLNERIVSLEAQVRKLNDSQGFVSVKGGSFKLER